VLRILLSSQQCIAVTIVKLFNSMQLQYVIYTLHSIIHILNVAPDSIVSSYMSRLVALYAAARWCTWCLTACLWCNAENVPFCRIINGGWILPCIEQLELHTRVICEQTSNCVLVIKGGMCLIDWEVIDWEVGLSDINVNYSNYSYLLRWNSLL
jgi:hypothetical protein